MGYDYSTGRCDEQCPGCKNYACIDNPDKKRMKKERLEREGSSLAPRTCAFCGRPFVPVFPGQRYCSHEDSPECFNEREDSRLTAIQWIRRRGYRTKQEFIADFGEEEWLAIQ